VRNLPVRSSAVNQSRWTRIAVALVALSLLAAACSSDDSSSSNDTTTTTNEASNRDPNALLGAEQVKALQEDLTAVGCFSGTVDGIVGPVTRAGISAFQEAEDLPVDSQYTAATKDKLAIVVGDGVKVCATAPVPAPTTGPPCTSAAVLAGLPSGSAILDFGCSGAWAWAGYDVDANQGGYEATALLKAEGSSWASVDRGQYCVPASNIPSDIYDPGCTTN
jgi:peptidoglycan hydrolase-like protein with peptidoglycan-binding domain